MLCAALITPLIRRLAPRLGLVDQPGHRKVHVNPTPMGGGIAVFAGIAVPVIVILAAGLGGWLNLHLDEMPSVNRGRMLQLATVATGAVLLFLTGLADDRWNLSWKGRLGIQLAVSVATVAAGVRATVFVSQPWVGALATILWIIVLTNAMNFLDNMDALSAGIGVIASLVFAVMLLTMVQHPAWLVAGCLLLLAGSLSGFLVWNRPPASIFMGDSGSNLIGYLLATLSVVGTFYENHGSRHVILAPLCVLAVPLYDFCSVILIRLSEGRSPFHGDKSHFSHRLVELGLRSSHAVMTIHLATLMTGLGGLLLYHVADWTGALLVISLIACVLAVIAILETVGRRTVADHVEAAAKVVEQNEV
ncbi:MAG: undecaprenyl/decaprenyl-phosphate alpha-N-acetylglucosaminyl 1-phosphate transferase [Planctomycetaceae bacterium]|nr:undecaprenyl/decaprenyl-phosphate alpha-N-acetylglucosaminyl 1-phosphate transferase [Planctomycetaceae bacterium]